LRLKLPFGYMEAPNVPRALAIATSFFLSRRALPPAARSGMRPVGTQVTI
jgi:K+ transporter